MGYGCNTDRSRAGLREEDSVIAAAEAEVDQWRLEPFHVSSACNEIPVDAVEDVERDLAVDCAQIGACFGAPFDG